MKKRLVVPLLLTLTSWVLAATLTAQAPSPDDHEAILRQAMARAQADDIGGAIAVLEPLVGKADTPQPILGFLGALYLETGRAADAYSLLKPLADVEQPNPAVLYNAGRAALSTGDIQGIEYLEQSLAMVPGSPAARELGLVYGRQGRWRDAYLLLKPWAQGHPDDHEVRLAAAACAVQLKRASEAEALLSDLPQEGTDVKMLWGQLLLLQGDPYGALATLKPIVNIVPQAVETDLRHLLAKAYVQVGDAAEAERLLRGRVDGNPALAVQLSYAQYQKGDIEAALATLEPFGSQIAVAEDGPVDWMRDRELATTLAIEYGRLLAASGRYEEALPPLEIGLQLDPSRPEGWQAFGQALAAVGRETEARVALEQFKTLSERSTTNLAQAEQDLEDATGREIRRGFRLAYDGKPDSAFDIARREMALAPNDFRPLLLAAHALLKLQRPEDALQPAEQAVQMAPESADAAYQRGTVRMALDDLEGAEQDLRRALELAGNHLAALNDLAVLELTRGNNGEARQLLERALEINPNDPTAQQNLAGLQ